MGSLQFLNFVDEFLLVSLVRQHCAAFTPEIHRHLSLQLILVLEEIPQGRRSLLVMLLFLRFVVFDDNGIFVLRVLGVDFLPKLPRGAHS